MSKLNTVEHLLNKSFWKRNNNCGLCYMGPCMCIGIGDIQNRIIPPENDDHMMLVNPGEIRARTIAFVNEMREVHNFGVKRTGNGVKRPLIQLGDREWYT